MGSRYTIIEVSERIHTTPDYASEILRISLNKLAQPCNNKALAEGVDIMVENKDENTIYAIAVKSGPSVFNNDSKNRQVQNFNAAHKLAQQAKAR